MTTAQLLNQAFSANWMRPALVTHDESMSYRELYGRADEVRQTLEARCSPGDTVALRLSNGWPFAAAYLACMLGGYRFVPVNLELAPETQEYILSRIGARVILEDDAALRSSRLGSPNAPRFDEALCDTSEAIFFTSGTTGQPKGVCHALGAMVDNVVAFNRDQGLDAGTRLYHVLPMAYMAGFLNTLLSPWLAGGTIVLGSRFRPVDALQFWQRPLAAGVNAIWLTPTLAAILARMNRDPEIGLRLGRQMRHVFCGTAPLSAAVRDDFRAAFGCPLQESYGMSEVLLVSAQRRSEAESALNVGRPLPGIRAEFRTVPERNQAELVIHTPYALKNYLLEGGESSPLLDDGGMPSGDSGCLEDGALVITGRLKDLIIRGGINVSPVAVENALMRQQGVREIAVVGVPHEVWGEAIVACVVPDAQTDSQGLLSSLQQRAAVELGNGMQPDRYVFLERLPRATTGKVQKHILADSLR